EHADADDVRVGRAAGLEHLAQVAQGDAGLLLDGGEHGLTVADRPLAGDVEVAALGDDAGGVGAARLGSLHGLLHVTPFRWRGGYLTMPAVMPRTKKRWPAR